MDHGATVAGSSFSRGADGRHRIKHVFVADFLAIVVMVFALAVLGAATLLITTGVFNATHDDDGARVVATVDEAR